MRPALACAGGVVALGVQLGRLLKKGAPLRSLPDADRGEAAGPGVEAGVPKVETKLIDGKAIAAEVRSEIKAMAAELEREHGVTPGLAVILVGARKDSLSYVRNKKKAAAEVCFHTVDVGLPETVSEEDLLAEVEKLNGDPKVHAILVQLPLPKHIDEARVLRAIRVDKDADGFSAANVGNLVLRGGEPPLAVPCTPAGCVELLQRSGVEVSGKNAVVIGRSNIVGMPVSQLLQSMDATVTVCHSRTRDMARHVRQADIVVAAIGKAGYVPGEWLKPGCCVIDVGINAVEDATKKLGHRLVGDVNFEEAQGIAAHITPVPGGVGPMTIAMLLKNTLNLARHSAGLPRVPLRQVQSAPQATTAPCADGSLAAVCPVETVAAPGGALSLPRGKDFAVSMNCSGGGIWESAVQASGLRKRVQELSGGSAPPAVVIRGFARGDASVSLITLADETVEREVLCSASSLEEASAALDGRKTSGASHEQPSAAPAPKVAPCVEPHPAAADAAKAKAVSLPAGKDFVVAMSCPAPGSNIWEAAVGAAPLRSRVCELSGGGRPPSVRVDRAAPRGGGAAAVSLVALGEEPTHREEVLCSAASIQEAAAALSGGGAGAGAAPPRAAEEPAGHAPPAAAKPAGSPKVEPAKLAALAADEDFALVMDCKGGDIWEAAVGMSFIRDKVQRLSNKTAPPAVVLQASADGGLPVSLVALGRELVGRRVLCSAPSLAEAAEALLGA